MPVVPWSIARIIGGEPIRSDAAGRRRDSVDAHEGGELARRGATKPAAVRPVARCSRSSSTSSSRSAGAHGVDRHPDLHAEAGRERQQRRAAARRAARAGPRSARAGRRPVRLRGSPSGRIRPRARSRLPLCARTRRRRGRTSRPRSTARRAARAAPRRRRGRRRRGARSAPAPRVVEHRLAAAVVGERPCRRARPGAHDLGAGPLGERRRGVAGAAVGDARSAPARKAAPQRRDRRLRSGRPRRAPRPSRLAPAALPVREARRVFCRATPAIRLEGRLGRTSRLTSPAPSGRSRCRPATPSTRATPS